MSTEGAERDAGARDERRAGYPGWRVAVAAAVGVFFAALVVVTFPVLLKPLSAEFGWSREAVARAFGLAALVAAVCAAPLGFLLDRVEPRRVAVPCLAVFGCLFASLALLTPRLGHLYALFALLGMAGIGTSPVAYGRAISTWFRERRGLALAIVVAGGALGGLLHPLAMDALIARIGWRGACAVFGAAVLVLGVPVVARGVCNAPAGSDGGDERYGSALGAALRTRAFWCLLAALGCGTLAQNSVIVHLHALLTDRGIDASRAALALSVMAAAAVIGRVATGLLIDRVSAAAVGAVMLALAALGAYQLAGAGDYAAALCGAVLVGFGTGGEADVVPYLVSRHFGLRSFASLYGLAWMAGGIGGALGPILLGKAFDESGTYAPALLRVACIALAAVACMLALPRPRAADAR